MLSISKPDHCAERASLALLSAYQEYLMTFKLMTSQVVQRARPLITHICVVGIQRVNLTSVLITINIMLRLKWRGLSQSSAGVRRFYFWSNNTTSYPESSFPLTRSKNFSVICSMEFHTYPRARIRRTLFRFLACFHVFVELSTILAYKGFRQVWWHHHTVSVGKYFKQDHDHEV